MIIKCAPWTHDAYFVSEHPEYAAIRSIVMRSPQHDFVLVGHGLRYEYFRYGRTSFYNLGSGSKPKFALSFFLNFWLPFLLRPSVVVGGGGINLIPISIASLFTRAKFVAVVGADIWYSILDLPTILRRLFRVLLRASFNRASAVMAISESIERELRYDYRVKPGKVFVYRLKVSDLFSPQVPSDLKKALNPFGPVVLTVCRISPQKGLEYLVEASRAVVDRVPNVKFVIRAYSSERRYEQRIRNLISEYHVERNFKIIIEFSAYEELPKYMVAADIFVLPSVSEGLGVVLLEAMASGVPAIGSNVGGIPDVIRHEYNGLLVEARDASGLASSITRLLLDESLRRRLSRGALSTAASIRENEFETLLRKSMFAG